MEIPKLSEYAPEYIERKSLADKWKRSTIKTYKALLSQYILPNMGNKQISRITVADFDRLVAKMFERNISTRRVNATIILLKKIMNDAHQNLIDHDKRGKAITLVPEIEYATKNRLKDEETESDVVKVDPFTLEEISKALDNLPDLYRPFFTMLAYTGCRPNEALALRWNRIDFENNQILLNRGRVDGVENKTKTYNTRGIPMVPALRRVLEQLKSERDADEKRHVFCDADGNLIPEKHLYRIWGRTLVKAGVRHRNMYQLRHSFATNALKNNVALPTVQKLLGHSSLQTTIQHYLRNSQIEQSDVAALNKAFA